LDEVFSSLAHNQIEFLFAFGAGLGCLDSSIERSRQAGVCSLSFNCVLKAAEVWGRDCVGFFD
jgi:hypothetical protein